ncbi:MAG: hypothetical protein AB7V49_19325, partial [Mycolicibacterium sp.]
MSAGNTRAKSAITRTLVGIGGAVAATLLSACGHSAEVMLVQTSIVVPPAPMPAPPPGDTLVI